MRKLHHGVGVLLLATLHLVLTSQVILANCSTIVSGLDNFYDPSKGNGFLAIRSDPSAKATQIGQIFNGEVLQINKRQDDWLFVTTTDNISGWVFGSYVTQVCGPTIEVPSYTIDFSLSSLALKAMKGETFIVLETIYGDESKSSYTTEDGIIDLNHRKFEILFPEAQAKMRPIVVKPDNLDKIDGKLQLYISVYSGRHTSKNNILDCQFDDKDHPFYIDEKTLNFINFSPKITAFCTLVREKRN